MRARRPGRQGGGPGYAGARLLRRRRAPARARRAVPARARAAAARHTRGGTGARPWPPPPAARGGAPAPARTGGQHACVRRKEGRLTQGRSSAFIPGESAKHPRSDFARKRVHRQRPCLAEANHAFRRRNRPERVWDVSPGAATQTKQNCCSPEKSRTQRVVKRASTQSREPACAPSVRPTGAAVTPRRTALALSGWGWGLRVGLGMAAGWRGACPYAGYGPPPCGCVPGAPSSSPGGYRNVCELVPIGGRSRV